MEQEAVALDMGDYRVHVPSFMKEIVAEITHQARRSPDINQRSGVSVRASVANYEALLANAFRRALRIGETDVVPRMSDLPFVLPSLQGKVEFEAMEEGQEDRITGRILAAGIKAVFDRRFNVDMLADVVLAFDEGFGVETAEDAPSAGYEEIVEQLGGLEVAVESLAEVPVAAARASAIEFVLEGLHLHKLLNKKSSSGRSTFTG